MTEMNQNLRGIIGEKRGLPIYETNPSVPSKDQIARPRRTRVGTEQKGLLIDEGTGEILGRGGAVMYEWEEVDKERFVKLFLSGLKQASGLSKAGLSIFEVVYNQVREKPNSDKMELSFYTAAKHITGLNDRTYQRGLRELLEKEFLFRSPYEGVFFINIKYLFNGDRLAFVKGYHIKSNIEQEELALEASAGVPALPAPEEAV
jgi:hypothetical protein